MKSRNAGEIIREQTGIGPDYVFDVTGSQVVQAVDLVRKGGRVVLFGVNKNPSVKWHSVRLPQKRSRFTELGSPTQPFRRPSGFWKNTWWIWRNL
ncbi:MAG: zinc-binding dehydrogenase [Blautia marasmi]